MSRSAEGRITLDPQRRLLVVRLQRELSDAVMALFRDPVMAALVILERTEPHTPGPAYRLPGRGFHSMYRIRSQIEFWLPENERAVQNHDSLGRVIRSLADEGEGILEEARNRYADDTNPYFRLTAQGLGEVERSGYILSLVRSARGSSSGKR